MTRKRETVADVLDAVKRSFRDQEVEIARLTKLLRRQREETRHWTGKVKEVRTSRDRYWSFIHDDYARLERYLETIKP